MAQSNPSIAMVLQAIKSKGTVSSKVKTTTKPHFGTTVFIAHCELKMRMGIFRAYVFQDLIHKGYIIALAIGDIQHADILYTRIHSSCVTSETLRGCDCDCAKQLEGALEIIAERGAGILFYLIQEGRGVGYVAKARDRMLVQASLDKLSTFEAYRAMGLKKDYRNYEGIASIYHLLGLKAPFVVLTNNPDKVEALESLGVSIKGTESIEFDAGPYNLAYLKSKAESGHVLNKASLLQLRSAIPPESVIPFNPYALSSAQRFIYVAKYYLPMKPVGGQIVLTAKQHQLILRRDPKNKFWRGTNRLIENMTALDDGRILVMINRKNLGRYRKKNPNDDLVTILTTPYWFAVHAYYDIVSGQDFVVLTHGKTDQGKAPIVRIHSESIFDRFPLIDVENRDKLKESARLIVQSGCGLLVLLYNDGRGAGFGAHATDRMMCEQHTSTSSDESYQKLGVEYDLRDYDAAVTLIAQHVPQRHIQMIMNSPDGLVRKQEHAVALHKHGMHVDNWIFLDSSA